MGAHWETLENDPRISRSLYCIICSCSIHNWIIRNHGEVDYFLTQTLSGHGRFNKYLYVRERADSPNCFYCGEEDDAEHTLFTCARWAPLRCDYTNSTGKPFNVANLMVDLLESEAHWQITYPVVRLIVETKSIEIR